MASDLTAGDVAKQFLMSYFDCLAKRPDQVSKFYDKTRSSCTRADGSADGTTVSGRDAIKSLLETWPYRNARVSLDPGSVDHQEMAGGSIFVVVTGTIVANDAPIRAFVQTIILAVLETSSRYYVQHDVMRLLDATVAKIGAGMEPATTEAAPAPAAPAPKVEEPAVEEPEPVEEPAAAAPVEEAEPVVESAPEEAAPAEEPAKAAAPVAKKAPVARPTSYAAAAAMLGKAAPAPQPPKRPATRRPPAAAAGSGAAEAAPAAAAPAPSNKGVFLRVPATTKESEVRAFLKQFGGVDSVNMTGLSRGYVIADMSADAGATAAIEFAKANEGKPVLSVDGMDQPVEIKPARSKGGSRSSTRGRGGRGGDRNGGRGGRRDDGGRGDSRDRNNGGRRGQSGRGRGGRGRGRGRGGEGRGERNNS